MFIIIVLFVLVLFFNGFRFLFFRSWFIEFLEIDVPWVLEKLADELF